MKKIIVKKTQKNLYEENTTIFPEKKVTALTRVTNGELPDCPACGRNEWVCLPSGDFQCSCGHSLKGGEKQC